MWSSRLVVSGHSARHIIAYRRKLTSVVVLCSEKKRDRWQGDFERPVQSFSRQSAVGRESYPVGARVANNWQFLFDQLSTHYQ